MSKKLSTVLFFIASVALIVVDQITKRLAINFLRDSADRSMTVIPGLLKFNYLENTAAAMGLFEGMIWLVMTMGVVVAIGIVAAVFFYNSHTWASYTSATLILAGGIGNLIDRLTNLTPTGERYVVDFIHVEFFPYIFNFADCCVTIGAVFLVIHFVICARQEKRLAGQGS